MSLSSSRPLNIFLSSNKYDDVDTDMYLSTVSHQSSLDQRHYIIHLLCGKNYIKLDSIELFCFLSSYLMVYFTNIIISHILNVENRTFSLVQNNTVTVETSYLESGNFRTHFVIYIELHILWETFNLSSVSRVGRNGCRYSCIIQRIWHPL